MSVILYAEKWINVFTQPEDQANPGADDTRIMGDDNPLNSPGIGVDRRGLLWDRDQHGTATAAATHI
jgi:hypothetical protein